jgi:hypothetical protein
MTSQESTAAAIGGIPFPTALEDALLADTPVPRCPRCAGPYVYNGNYFCADTRHCGYIEPSPSDIEDLLAASLHRGDIKREG